MLITLQWAQQTRAGCDERAAKNTLIIGNNLDEIPLYDMKPRLAKIMAEPMYRQNNSYMKGRPEGFEPLYQLVVNSKVGVLVVVVLVRWLWLLFVKVLLRWLLLLLFCMLCLTAFPHS